MNTTEIPSRHVAVVGVANSTRVEVRPRGERWGLWSTRAESWLYYSAATDEAPADLRTRPFDELDAGSWATAQDAAAVLATID